MRAKEFIIKEGGWDSTVTQGTVINPITVKTAMKTMQQFVNDFNKFAATKDIAPMKLGHPTGSSAYHDVDDADKIYGDVDLQVIVPELEQTAGLTNARVQAFWNNTVTEFISTAKPSYVHDDSSPGHPIVSIGGDEWVQIDLMYHTEKLSTWGRFRVTPERGLKGLLHGNMFSVLGDLLTMSIQHHGVQLKVRDKVRMAFPKALKNYELRTVTTNIDNFVKDIFDYEYKEITGNDPKTAKIDPTLSQFPGVDRNDIKISTLINAVKGLAKSFELNDMFGKGSLSNYNSANDFISAFVTAYDAKAMKDVNSAKRDKAETPDAVARAAADREKVTTGLDKVKGMFGAN